MAIILGLNAYHGDSSACILVDGELVAAAEEERFTRIKHWAGMPAEAIKYCLEEAGVGLGDVDHVALNRDPRANLFRKGLYILATRPSLGIITDRARNAARIKDVRADIAERIGYNGKELNFKIHFVEHHKAHLGSSFFVSPFDEAAAISVDGFGDFVGTMWGVAKGGSINVVHSTYFPHSLGLFYLAFTQYLGFTNYGDEYKVMGLAAYGRPSYMEQMRTIVRTPTETNVSSGGLFELNLDYFVHHNQGAQMTWAGGEPVMGPVYSGKFAELFGPPRKKGEPLEDRHKDIAASLQARYEEVFYQILNYVHEKTNMDALALSGGCAMNSVANGKVFKNTPFKDVYIQPAAGDAGGAIGAAYCVWHERLGSPRKFVLEKPYLGPEYDSETIRAVIRGNDAELREEKCNVTTYNDMTEVCRTAAEHIAKGKVVGWFQGRMEWGPRALGNRSIVCDPRRPDMKDILNLKIKRRESFRPFAPSIHVEAVDDYFETGYPDPFMLKVYSIRPEKRGVIPAVTHVDGTGRLQTVGEVNNPLYWRLIDEFRKITGVPVVLNTSFNENEPIVNTPLEALKCFLRTKMDVLVLGSHVINRLD